MLLGLMGCFQILPAQTDTLTGTLLLDRYEYRPLVRATVYFFFGPLGLPCKVEGNGKFLFENDQGVSPDSIWIKAPGFDTLTVYDFRDGDTLYLSPDARIAYPVQALPPDPPQPWHHYEMPSIEIRYWFSFSNFQSLSAFSREEIRQFPSPTLEPMLNSLPGVKMDTRGMGGSRRLSIRGSVLRSPFGVRNIRAYWEEMPLSIPDGSVPLEIVDPANLQYLEVVKGPTQAIRGAVNGGALYFHGGLPINGEPELKVESEFQLGEYGFLRSATTIGLHQKKYRLFASYIKQNLDGYRTQEFNRKDQLYLRGEWKLGIGHTLKAWFWHYQGDWGLPGAIDLNTANLTPRSANPFSVTANASVDRARTRLGVHHSYAFSPQARIYNTLYGYRTTKVNPYGTSAFFNGYKDEAGWGLGSRSRFEYYPKSSDYSKLRMDMLQVGLEMQGDLNDQMEFENNAGNPGKLKIDRKITSLQSTTWLLARARWKHDLQIVPALNLNLLSYRIQDRFDVDTLDFTGNRSFNPVLAPHINFKWQFREFMFVSGGANWGFSPPALWEISNFDGSINTDLKGEQGQQYHLQLEYTPGRRTPWAFAVEGYVFRVNNTIIPQEQANGSLIYVNQGRTQQDGLEAWVKYNYEKTNRQFFQQIRPWVSAAYQPYRFLEYEKDGIDLSGNHLTGGPQFTLAAGVSVKTRPGVYLFSTSRVMGKTAIDDINSTYQEPYFLLEGRMGWVPNMPVRLHRFELDVFAGVNNATNTSYTSFLQLNGFGGRFYNPAAPRNFFGGLKVGFKIDRLR